MRRTVALVLQSWVLTPPCCSAGGHTVLLPSVQQDWDILRLQVSSGGSQEQSGIISSSRGSTSDGLLERDEKQRSQAGGLYPTTESLNLVLSVYQEEGRLEDALQVWENYMQLGVSVDMTSCRLLLGIFHRLGDARNAVRLYRKMQDEFLVVEAKQELQTLVLDMCVGRLSDGLESGENRYVLQTLFRKMQYAQLPICKFVCRSLLLKCGEKKDDHVMAKSLHQYMRQRRTLTTRLCNHTIGVLGRHDKWWAALEVFEQMLESGPQPDLQTRRLIRAQFERMLFEAKSKNMWKSSLLLIAKMEEKGLRPDKQVWNWVMITCARAGRTEETVALFQRMVRSQCKPDTRSFGALLSAFEKQGLVGDMERVLVSMHKSGIAVSEGIYTTMISGYGKAGMLAEINGLVHGMEEAGLKPSLVTFNAIITSCARAGDARGARQWFERMKSEQVEPNSTTYNKLVEALAGGGRWREAVSVYVEMRELGMEPSPWAYDAVALACRENGVHLERRWLGHRPRQLRPNRGRLT